MQALCKKKNCILQHYWSWGSLLKVAWFQKYLWTEVCENTKLPLTLYMMSVNLILVNCLLGDYGLDC